MPTKIVQLPIGKSGYIDIDPNLHSLVVCFSSLRLSTVLGWSTYGMISTGTGAGEHEPYHISQHVTLSSFSSFKLHFTFYTIRDGMILSP